MPVAEYVPSTVNPAPEGLPRLPFAWIEPHGPPTDAAEPLAPTLPFARNAGYTTGPTIALMTAVAPVRVTPVHLSTIRLLTSLKRSRSSVAPGSSTIFTEYLPPPNDTPLAGICDAVGKSYPTNRLSRNSVL